MRPWPSSGPSDAPATRRERAFDLLRGLCIVSMVFGHVAAGSLLAQVTHLFEWVDGAVGFVFISGLVLALVHRATVDRLGLPAALGCVVRRIRVIYLANAVVTLFALAIGTWLTGRTDMPSAHSYGWPMALLRVSLVAVNPPYSVLGLYVYLMLGALGALVLLARGRSGLLLALSVVVYVGVRIADLDTSLPGHGHNVEFHLGGWQLLFVLGMLVGWHWRDRQLGRRLLDWRVQLPAVLMVVGLSGLAHLVLRGALGETSTAWFDAAFDKATLGPGVLLFAIVILVSGYGAATWIGQSAAARWFAPVETIGRHSLNSYLIATFAAIAFPAVLGYRSAGWFAQALAIALLLAAYAWARFREGDRAGGKMVGAATSVNPPTPGVAAPETTRTPVRPVVRTWQLLSTVLGRAPRAESP